MAGSVVIACLYISAPASRFGFQDQFIAVDCSYCLHCRPMQSSFGVPEACEKDPGNPRQHQHFLRLSVRSGRHRSFVEVATRSITRSSMVTTRSAQWFARPMIGNMILTSMTVPRAPQVWEQRATDSATHHLRFLRLVRPLSRIFSCSELANKGVRWGSSEPRYGSVLIFHPLLLARTILDDGAYTLLRR
ncbi:hypothetical protein BXZ70DRAFT_483546 [Cristinia sonorae]|uniref:Uncharacterized protein n=1 Tax=Cristinia sonorae TaxID=1940300 RepID=A0A8K0UJA6_9AGAR|nr:hypothetical protein BXZ70DRAFT_483546 [Cristinia sonorae]